MISYKGFCSDDLIFPTITFSFNNLLLQPLHQLPHWTAVNYSNILQQSIHHSSNFPNIIMRLTSILYTAMLAVASVDASAASEAQPDATDLNHFCHRSGQPCSKLKRAAEAVAEALADPIASPKARPHQSHQSWCSVGGEMCAKAKRDALALAEAVAEAQVAAAAESEPGKKTSPLTHVEFILSMLWCWTEPGG